MKTRIPSTTVALLAAALLLVVAGCQQATRPASLSSTSSRAAEWDDYVTALLESEFDANPPTAVWAGRHEFDGRLPDWSRSGIDNEIRRMHAQRERALQFDDAPLSTKAGASSATMSRRGSTESCSGSNRQNRLSPIPATTAVGSIPTST
ncbi:MAG: hypothetical protein ABI541_07740 [Betaproteobacteria bacterium]